MTARKDPPVRPVFSTATLLDDDIAETLGHLLSTTCGLAGDVPEAFTAAGVEKADRLIIGHGPPLDNGRVQLADHLDGRHGQRVWIPPGHALVCADCLVELLLQQVLPLSPWGERQIIRFSINVGVLEAPTRVVAVRVDRLSRFLTAEGKSTGGQEPLAPEDPR